MPEANRELVEKVTEVAEKIADPKGIEIVEVQVLGGGSARLVRIYIDKPEGVSHADCEWISDQAGAIFDAEDTIPGASYTLEVSSPGVERALSKPRDFERFTGQKAKIVLREPLENQRHWEGVLAGFHEGRVALVVNQDAPAGKRVEIPLSQVKKANLKFEW